MPAYDSLGIVSEKHSIIIDIGSAYTRCGYAGEFSPRWIVPTEIMHPQTKKIEKIWDHFTSVDTLSLLLKEFLHQLYFRHLGVNPRERRMVLVESVMCPRNFREVLAEILYGHFDVPAMMHVPSHLMSLVTLGIRSGLVIEMGYKEAYVLPVYEGVTILKALEFFPASGEDIHKRLTEKLDGTLNPKIIEDIKVRTCFVTTKERGDVLETSAAPTTIPHDVDYFIGGDQKLKIPGSLREWAPEVLFEMDPDARNMATIIFDCLKRCPIDTRKELAANLVVIGGTSLLPGFMARLKSELNTRLPESKLFINEFKFHKSPANRNYVAWLGGAIFGATDMMSMRCVSKESYVANGLDCWSNYDTISKE